jgi:hypothetical protein
MKSQCAGAVKKRMNLTELTEDAEKEVFRINLNNAKIPLGNPLTPGAIPPLPADCLAEK